MSARLAPWPDRDPGLCVMADDVTLDLVRLTRYLRSGRDRLSLPDLDALARVTAQLDEVAGEVDGRRLRVVTG